MILSLLVILRNLLFLHMKDVDLSDHAPGCKLKSITDVWMQGCCQQGGNENIRIKYGFNSFHCSLSQVTI